MARNPAADLIQFIAGGSLFGAGGFLLLNQVMASSSFGVVPGRGLRWGGGVFPIGTPGKGLLEVDWFFWTGPIVNL